MTDDPIVLETERLRLRRISHDDVDVLLELFADPVATRYLHGVMSRTEVEEWVERTLSRYTEYGYGLWGVTPRNSGELVGYCGLIPQEDVDGRDETEIGYGLLPRFQGRGYATEAARGCRDWAFEYLRVPRVISLIAPENGPSRRVAERVGMHVEKEIERWERRILVYALEADPD